MEAAATAKKPAPSYNVRAAIAAAARAELMRRHLWRFLVEGWREMHGTEIDVEPYIMGFCELVQHMLESWLVVNGKANARQRENVEAAWRRCGLEPKQGVFLIQNLIANMAPSTLKSTILMVFAPAWMWLHDPSFSLGCTSANDENVKRDSDAHRDLVQSPWYRKTFDIKWRIRGNADAVNKWQNTAGGTRVSRTYLATWTGVHVDALFVDDPDDALKVFDEPQRKRVHNKWTRALSSRVRSQRKSFRIVLQQRVHVEDLSGFLVTRSAWSPTNRKGWFRWALAVEFGYGPSNENMPKVSPLEWRDQRTEKGQTLSAEWFSPDIIEDMRTNLGPQGFDAQANQNPDREDGGMFERIHFRYFRIPGQLPSSRLQDTNTDAAFELEEQRDGGLKLDELSITVDATFGSVDEKTASNVGLLTIAELGGRQFVFDDRSKTMTYLQTVDAIKAIIKHPLALADPTNRYRTRVRKVYIEMKANGRAVVEALEKAMAEDPELIGPDGNRAYVEVVRCETDGGYISRAAAMQGPIAAGTVYLLEGAPWVRAFLGELCGFPAARRDDRVDALSQYMRKRMHVSHTRARKAAGW